jgi:signal transduction histidine kinase
MGQLLSRSESRGSIESDLGILESSSVAIAAIVAADGRLVAANAALRKFLGAGGDVVVQRFADLFADAAEWERCRDATSVARPVALRLRSPTGVARSFKGDVRAVGEGAKRHLAFVLVENDAEHSLRAAVQHSARMEALGSLTAGIAHDFNNLLTVLVGNLYLLAEELRDRPKVFDKLKAARDAGKRGAELIKQLLAFARREEIHADSIDPAKVIDNVIPLLRRALGVRVALEANLARDAGAIRASAAQFESVVVNLAVNARDAIDGKGRIGIEVRRLQVSHAEAVSLGLERGGSYIAVSVADNGGGIPPEVLERVFEPFFSTKGERGGTGLGLSMVRWFAEQSGGSVRIESAVGQGTTVTLLLPRLADTASDVGEGTMPLSTLPAGNEGVVVLALDEALRSTIRQTLEVLGYRVRIAVGVEDMLAALSADDVRIIVVDGLGRTDADVLIRARALRPDLRILLTTDPGRSPERSSLPSIGTVAKPFTLADLAGAVRRTLDGAIG